MKKTFLYACAIAMLAIILPSCLGENESSYTGSGEFGVISTQSGIKYAAVGNGLGGSYITWDGISTYSEGDAVLLSYKINTNNLISGTNIIKADYASSTEDGTFPRGDQKNITVGTVDTTLQANSAFFKAFNLKMYSSNTFFSDRWLFSYSATKKDGEVLTPKFYYDATKQVQKDKTPLPANTAVVDVTFTKSGVPVGTTDKPEEKMIVANLTGLRNALPYSATDSNISVTIWFRIMKEDSKATSGYVLTYQNMGTLLYTKSEQ